MSRNSRGLIRRVYQKWVRPGELLTSSLPLVGWKPAHPSSARVGIIRKKSPAPPRASVTVKWHDGVPRLTQALLLPGRYARRPSCHLILKWHDGRPTDLDSVMSAWGEKRAVVGGRSQQNAGDRPLI